MRETGEIATSLNDSIDIVHFNKITLLKIPYRPVISLTVLNSGGSVKSDTTYQEEVKYKYFIYKNGEDKGYEYNSLDSESHEEHVVDTFLRNRIFANLVFYEPKIDSLVMTQRLSQNELIDKYIPKIKYNDSYPDTCFYFFDKTLLSLDYTLSKELDSLRKMKLNKVVFVYNRPLKPYKDSTFREEWVFGIKPCIIKNEKEVINFIKKYESQRNVEPNRNNKK